MSENNIENKAYMPKSRLMLGRRQIFSSESEVTRENVTKILADAYSTHMTNVDEITYLYNYLRGKQEVQGREKTNHREICAKITENVAAEIKDFWSGYIGGEPIQYVSTDGENTEGINALNKVCYGCSKSAVDKELIDWELICGVGLRLVVQNPLEMYAIDPRRAYVVYQDQYDKKPLCGVVYDKYTTKDGADILHYNVYTKDKFFEVKDGAVIKEENNVLGIQLIEYIANTSRQGCYERALPLLDAINDLQSNRLDGVAQQIQSLLVLYNAELPEDTSGDDIRNLGIIELISKDGQKGDIKEIATVLDQTAVQIFKKDLYESALRICGVPATNGNTSDSSNNGAVILKSGWQGAEARAKDFELLFKRSERELLRVVQIIASNTLKFDFDPATTDAHFTRRNYEDISTKASVLVQLLSTNKVAPEICFKVCGLFTDPESAYAQSEEYAKAMEKKALAVAKASQTPAQGTGTTEDKVTDNEEPVTD